MSEAPQVIDLDREAVRQGLREGSILLVDVREPHEFAAGHIPGSVSHPLSTFDPSTLPEGKRPPALMVALHVWSMAHGIASLFGRPDRSRRKLPMSPEELLEAGLLIYLQSLGLAGGT